MLIVSVVGTRPQLIKAAALGPVLRRHHEEILVDTGQHWDEAMAGRFFAELSLPKPDHALGVGSGSHARQTAAMLERLEPILSSVGPDAVLVYGDTNSTLAGALAASKLCIPVSHVEAGLRSFDRTMPEEVNRVVVDHLSTWLFAPTQTAMGNLAAEGVAERVYLVGDLMQDLAARTVTEVREPRALIDIGTRLGVSLAGGSYIFATIHRASNREPSKLETWVRLLGRAAERLPVLLALHPGTRDAIVSTGVDMPPGVHVVPPQGYRTSIALQLHAAAVITDSGGIQREAAWLETPCLIVRDTTEWVEALDGSQGRMVLVGSDVDQAIAALDRIAPPGLSMLRVAERLEHIDLEPAGAAEAITSVLGSQPTDRHGAHRVPVLEGVVQ